MNADDVICGKVLVDSMCLDLQLRYKAGNKLVIQCYCQWYVHINNNQNFYNHVYEYFKVTGHSILTLAKLKHDYHISMYHNDH